MAAGGAQLRVRARHPEKDATNADVPLTSSIRRWLTSSLAFDALGPGAREEWLRRQADAVGLLVTAIASRLEPLDWSMAEAVARAIGAGTNPSRAALLTRCLN